MEPAEYFNEKKTIVLYNSYKLHRLPANADGSTRFRCQTCITMSKTVTPAHFIERTPNAESKHSNSCKNFSNVQKIGLQQYYSMKKDARNYKTSVLSETSPKISNSSKRTSIGDLLLDFILKKKRHESHAQKTKTSIHLENNQYHHY
ncbi:hypothetical protein BpHYR1_001025 [Brachionus plicatilis]|uniref:Uncharacterized protein n=1 Tax=Brachionus plicatilis TaxID=10195 RepID=A0A3M7QAQ3_BRAPC|nr:hypothetical protein BpHYR1_001025 [Brachionus plicatilis]